VYVSRADSGATGSYFLLQIVGGDVFSLLVTDDGNATRDQVDSTTLTGVGRPYFVVALRRGADIIMFIDGVNENQTTLTQAVGSLDNATALTRIGVRFDGSFPASGGLSLLRIGAGAPTDAQISEIHNFEKHLFQDNNACTLSGTSDDVKALAFDSDTNELYVASATDLSVFVGGVRTSEENAAYTSLSAIGGQNAKGN